MGGVGLFVVVLLGSLIGSFFGVFGLAVGAALYNRGQRG
jgi:hypothetical protein